MKKDAYEAAVEYILRRPHSEYELLLKLRRKGYLTLEIEDAFKILRQEKHLDDERLVRSLVLWHNEHKPYGRYGLSHRLQKKGFKRDQIDKALQEKLPPELEVKLLEDLARKKLALEKRLSAGSASAVKDLEPRDPLADNTQREKLARFLISRGFSNGLVLEVLEKLMPL